jgi:hypothetical protein
MIADEKMEDPRDMLGADAAEIDLRIRRAGDIVVCCSKVERSGCSRGAWRSVGAGALGSWSCASRLLL